MQTDDVAAIKACAGIYRQADVARHYNVHRSTVSRIWNGIEHTDVQPASDFPDIAVRYKAQDKAEDIGIYLRRGMSVAEVSRLLNIGLSTVYQYRTVVIG